MPDFNVLPGDRGKLLHDFENIDNHISARFVRTGDKCIYILVVRWIAVYIKAIVTNARITLGEIQSFLVICPPIGIAGTSLILLQVGKPPLGHRICCPPDMIGLLFICQATGCRGHDSTARRTRCRPES